MPYTINVDVWPQVKPFMRYINDIMGCSCFPDLLEAKVFPNAKEITESMAAFHVARNKKRVFDLGDDEVQMFAVGDGRTPRTAALFAYRTKWRCWSIDPALNVCRSWKVKRVGILPFRIEDLPPRRVKKAFIACVHSHARLEEVAKKLNADKRIIVSIPCCVPQTREREPDLEYVDQAIWSPCNVVKIWVDGCQ